MSKYALVLSSARWPRLEPIVLPGEETGAAVITPRIR
jgi:hypothetical protein